jgi:DNA-binding response OmpR family regulator
MMMKKTHTILVVDDERSMRELLEYMLSKEGYRSLWPKTAAQALERSKPPITT